MTVKSTIRNKLEQFFYAYDYPVEFSQEGEMAKWALGLFEVMKLGRKLSEWGEPAIDDLIEFADQTPYADARLAINIALGHIGSARALPYLMSQVNKYSSLEQQFVISALAGIGGAEVNELLLGLLAECKADCQYEGLLEALISSGDGKLCRQIFEIGIQRLPEYKLIDLIKNAEFHSPDDALDNLLPLLAYEKEFTVITVRDRIKLLGHLAAPRLLANLGAKGRYTRIYTAELLTCMLDVPEVIAPLCEQLLTSKSKVLREKVALGFAGRQEPQILAALGGALLDKEASVIETACNSLLKSASADLVALFAQALHSSVLLPRHRHLIVQAIGKLNSEAGNQLLLSALQYQDSATLRVNLRWLVKNKVWQALEPLLALQGNLAVGDDEDEDERLSDPLEKAIFKLYKMQPKSGARSRACVDSPEQLAAALCDKSASMRLAALKFLQKQPQMGHMDALEKLLFDPEKKVREQAIATACVLDPDGLSARLSARLKGWIEPHELLHILTALDKLSADHHLPILLQYEQSSLPAISQKVGALVAACGLTDEAIEHYRRMALVERFTNYRDPERLLEKGEAIIPYLVAKLDGYKELSCDLLSRYLEVLQQLHWQPQTPSQYLIYHASLGSLPADAVTDPELQSVALEYVSTLSEQPSYGSNIRKLIEVLASYLSHSVAGREMLLTMASTEYVQIICSALCLQPDDAAAKLMGDILVARLAADKAGEPQPDPYLSADFFNNFAKLRDANCAPWLASLLLEILGSRYHWSGLAASALIGLKGKEAIFELRSALRGAPSFFAIKGIIAALQQLGWQPDNERERALFYLGQENYQAILDLGLGHHLVPQLKALAAQEYSAKLVLQILHHLPDELGMESVIHNLTHPYQAVQEFVQQCVIGYGERAVPHLLALLGHRSCLLVHQAVVMLGKLKPRAAINPLCTLLKDTDGMYLPTWRAVIELLGRFKDPVVVPQLAHLLVTNRQIPIQRALLTALGKIGSAVALTAVEAMPDCPAELEPLRLKTIDSLQRRQK